MRKRLKHLIAAWLGLPSTAAIPSGPAAPAAPNPLDPTVLHDTVGFRDAALSGWVLDGSAELMAGFPITENDVVIDIGCGEGHFSAFCGAQGAEIILVDVNAAALGVAETRLRQTRARAVRAVLSDGSPLPLADDLASKVVITEVLEHVDDPEQLLVEAMRVGRPGALYLITVPDPVHEHIQKQGIAAPAAFEKPNHIRIFEREQFRALVSGAGLSIERETSSGFYWAMWWIFFWACKQDLAPPWHPLLAAWTRTWHELLNTEQGPHIKQVLDGFMPKSQIIIARKPL